MTTDVSVQGSFVAQTVPDLVVTVASSFVVSTPADLNVTAFASFVAIFPGDRVGVSSLASHLALFPTAVPPRKRRIAAVVRGV